MYATINQQQLLVCMHIVFLGGGDYLHSTMCVLFFAIRKMMLNAWQLFTRVVISSELFFNSEGLKYKVTMCSCTNLRL